MYDATKCPYSSSYQNGMTFKILKEQVVGKAKDGNIYLTEWLDGRKDKFIVSYEHDYKGLIAKKIATTLGQAESFFQEMVNKYRS